MNAPADVKSYMLEVGRRARAASRLVAKADSAAKDRALAAMAAAIRREAPRLIAENARDVEAARAAGEDAAFVDRLTLTPKSIEAMASGVEEVAKLADPVGEITERRKRPTGI